MSNLTDCVAMLVLYTLAPLLYRSASSVFYNLSLLSSDFFGLIFGARILTSHHLA
jgi:solute carrier family 35, member F1/2